MAAITGEPQLNDGPDAPDLLEGSEEGANKEKQPLNLSVQIQSPSACERHVTVQVSREDIDRYLEEALDERAPEANIPGFRAGRAPRKLVASLLRKELREQIRGSILLDAIDQVTSSESLTPISEPEFDPVAVKIPDEGPLTFEFDLEVRPIFELPQWRGLRLERPTREITDDDIEQFIAEHLLDASDLKPVDGPVMEQDVLVADVRFVHDGQEIAMARGLRIEVRDKLSFRDATMDGFAQAMIGALPGDRRTVSFTLAETAEQESLRGETIQAEFLVLEVLRYPRQPDYERVLDIWDLSSSEDLHEEVKRILERQVKYHQSRGIRKQITSLLTEASSWELPPKLLKRQAQRELERAIMELRSSGFSDAQIRHYANLLRQNVNRDTARALKEHFVLEKIAEAEGIEATEEDFEAQFQLMAFQSRESVRSVKARIEKRGNMDVLRNQIIEQKVIAKIEAEAHFRDVPFTFPRTDTTAVDFAVAGARGAENIPVAKHGDDQQELPKQTSHF